MWLFMKWLFPVYNVLHGTYFSSRGLDLSYNAVEQRHVALDLLGSLLFAVRFRHRLLQYLYCLLHCCYFLHKLQFKMKQFIKLLYSTGPSPELLLSLFQTTLKCVGKKKTTAVCGVILI